MEVRGRYAPVRDCPPIPAQRNPVILGLLQGWEQTGKTQHSIRVECACVGGELIREADPGIHYAHLLNPKWKQIHMLFINKDRRLKGEQTSEPA